MTSSHRPSTTGTDSATHTEPTDNQPTMLIREVVNFTPLDTRLDCDRCVDFIRWWQVLAFLAVRTMLARGRSRSILRHEGISEVRLFHRVHVKLNGANTKGTTEEFMAMGVDGQPRTLCKKTGK